MQTPFQTVRKLVRLTPARAFLLGTATMMMLPENTFAWLSLNYHEFSADTTYAYDEVPVVTHENKGASAEKPVSPVK